MQFDQAPHQRQADAQAALGAVDLIALHEDVEHMRQQVGRDADPGVAHAQHHSSPSSRIAISIVPPAGVYFSALSIRLVAICSRRVGVAVDPAGVQVGC
jgi:hypothetical protein